MLKDVFNTVQATCVICGEPVDGRYRRNNKYYCVSDFEIESPEEKQDARRKEKQTAEAKRLLP